MKRLFVGLITLSLAACGPAPFKAGGAAGVSEAEYNQFVSVCTGHTKNNAGACGCAGQKLADEGTHDGFLWSMAFLREDNAEADRLSTEMPVMEAAQALTALPQALASCH